MTMQFCCTFYCGTCFLVILMFRASEPKSLTSWFCDLQSETLSAPCTFADAPQNLMLREGGTVLCAFRVSLAFSYFLYFSALYTFLPEFDAVSCSRALTDWISFIETLLFTLADSSVPLCSWCAFICTLGSFQAPSQSEVFSLLTFSLLVFHPLTVSSFVPFEAISLFFSFSTDPPIDALTGTLQSAKFYRYFSANKKALQTPSSSVAVTMSFNAYIFSLNYPQRQMMSLEKCHYYVRETSICYFSYLQILNLSSWSWLTRAFVLSFYLSVCFCRPSSL